MRNTPTPHRLKQLGLLSLKEAIKKTGASQPTISRWVKSGQIVRAGRGLYFHPKSKFSPETLEFTIACAKFGPRSAIAGMSALFYYHLIDQVPSQIWVLVPPNRKDSGLLYRCLRSKTTSQFGISLVESFRITSVERTIIEAFKFATKIGPRIVIRAARKALQDGQTTEKKLGEMAKILKLRAVLQKYWEAVVS